MSVAPVQDVFPFMVDTNQEYEHDILFRTGSIRAVPKRKMICGQRLSESAILSGSV